MKSEIEEATAEWSKVWSASGNLQPSAPQYEDLFPLTLVSVLCGILCLCAFVKSPLLLKKYLAPLVRTKVKMICSFINLITNRRFEWMIFLHRNRVSILLTYCCLLYNKPSTNGSFNFYQNQYFLESVWASKTLFIINWWSGKIKKYRQE